MEVINQTPYPHLAYRARRPDGVFRTVVIMRGEFDFSDGPLRLASDQPGPRIETLFYGDPTRTSMKADADLLPFKPCGEVTFVDPVAHAPGRQPAAGWSVGIRVGPVEHVVSVTGPRSWEPNNGRWVLGAANSVVRVPVRYDLAFGGTCDEGLQDQHVFHANPVGVGWLGRAKPRRGATPVPAPQVEEAGDPVTDPQRTYPPAGLGAIHKAWEPRRHLLGTIDEKWKNEQWPRLPLDFSYHYFLASPEPLRLANNQYFRGYEQCEARNLTPDGRVHFSLPDATDYHLFLTDGSSRVTAHPLVIDTVEFRTEEKKCALVWRATAPLGNNAALGFIAPLVAAQEHLFKGKKFILPEHTRGTTARITT